MYQTRSRVGSPPDWINLNKNTKYNLIKILKELNVIPPQTASRDELIRIIQLKINKKHSPYKSKKMETRRVELGVAVDGDDELPIPEIDIETEPLDNITEETSAVIAEQEEEDQIEANNMMQSEERIRHFFDSSSENEEEQIESNREDLLRDVNSNDIHIPQQESVSDDHSDYSSPMLSVLTTPSIEQFPRFAPSRETTPTFVINEKNVSPQIVKVNGRRIIRKSHKKSKWLYTIPIILFIVIICIFVPDPLAQKVDVLYNIEKFIQEKKKENGVCTIDQLLNDFKGIDIEQLLKRKIISIDKSGNVIAIMKASNPSLFDWGDKHPAISGAIITGLVIFIYIIVSGIMQVFTMK